MQAQPEPLPTLPPLESTRRFKRQSFWQITFPIVALILLLMGGVSMLFFTPNREGLSIAADYGLILLILVALLVGLPIIGFVVALIYGMAWVNRKVPPLTNSAQRTMQGVYLTINEIMGKISSFLIGLFAAINGVANSIQKWGGLASQSNDPQPPEPGSSSPSAPPPGH
jgi:hypothetical protein